MFIEECVKCRKQFIRSDPAPTVGKKFVGETCRNKTRPCRGQLFDNILDWEDDLPEDDMYLASLWSTIADLNLCLGTTLQIMPSGSLPLKSKKYGGKVAICNLQPTKYDKKADLIIHTYVDDVFEKLLKRLGIEDIPEYNASKDPTKNNVLEEWTISSQEIKRVESLHKERIRAAKREIKDTDDLKKICKKTKIDEAQEN
jgi:mono-ADP-ribosyltransferase sirtuin 6